MSDSPPPLEFREPEEGTVINIDGMTFAFKLTDEETLTLKKARVVINKVFAIKGLSVEDRIRIHLKAFELYDFFNELLEMDKDLSILNKEKVILTGLQDLRDTLKTVLKK